MFLLFVVFQHSCCCLKDHSHNEHAFSPFQNFQSQRQLSNDPFVIWVAWKEQVKETEMHAFFRPAATFPNCIKVSPNSHVTTKAAKAVPE